MKRPPVNIRPGLAYQAATRTASGDGWETWTATVMHNGGFDVLAHVLGSTEAEANARAAFFVTALSKVAR